MSAEFSYTSWRSWKYYSMMVWFFCKLQNLQTKLKWIFLLGSFVHWGATRALRVVHTNTATCKRSSSEVQAQVLGCSSDTAQNKKITKVMRKTRRMCRKVGSFYLSVAQAWCHTHSRPPPGAFQRQCRTDTRSVFTDVSVSPGTVIELQGRSFSLWQLFYRQS